MGLLSSIAFRSRNSDCSSTSSGHESELASQHYYSVARSYRGSQAGGHCQQSLAGSLPSESICFRLHHPRDRQRRGIRIRCHYRCIGQGPDRDDLPELGGPTTNASPAPSLSSGKDPHPFLPRFPAFNAEPGRKLPQVCLHLLSAFVLE